MTRTKPDPTRTIVCLFFVSLASWAIIGAIGMALLT
jgi:hypothetical protein